MFIFFAKLKLNTLSPLWVSVNWVLSKKFAIIVATLNIIFLVRKKDKQFSKKKNLSTLTELYHSTGSTCSQTSNPDRYGRIYGKMHWRG